MNSPTRSSSRATTSGSSLIMDAACSFSTGLTASGGVSGEGGVSSGASLMGVPCGW
ncbi:hypothetical protein [Methylococcus sp. EFPC2]|uniref:hypothetical protein n=1 Tax=Methylococcus sp. EFPC2 TaxID=2812648 RepID=UPI001F08325E|nr:hypothetical protein [Methylococcus sp. EFPC2]